MIATELQDRVVRELRFDKRIDASRIGVATTGAGVVTLTGVVPTYLEKLEAEWAVKRVRGVDLESSRQPAPAVATRRPRHPYLGLACARDLTPDVASTLGLPAGTTGALVQSVEPFTPAANAGIRPGDLILEVNHQAVRARSDAARALSASKSGSPMFLLIQRQGVQQFVELRKG